MPLVSQSSDSAGKSIYTKHLTDSSLRKLLAPLSLCLLFMELLSLLLRSHALHPSMPRTLTVGATLAVALFTPPTSAPATLAVALLAAILLAQRLLHYLR